MYPIIRALLFMLPPEVAHQVTLKILVLLCRIPIMRSLLSRLYRPKKKHEIQVCGLSFSNPLGLAAGFDKNGHYLHEMAALGFGFVEIGSVTADGVGGNPKPRLFRLKKQRAIINRMGLNNHGVDALVERVQHADLPIPLLVNVAKTPRADLEGERAIQDYCTTVGKIKPIADIIVLNISCPNSGDGRTFESREALSSLLSSIRDVVPRGQKPIFLKISPDLSADELSMIVEVGERFDIDGFTATNTTTDRSMLSIDQHKLDEIGPGGLSGLPLHTKAIETVKILRALTSKPIIGLGGIRSVEEARNFLSAGANLIQIYTGFVYEGPGVIRKISDGLGQA
ncbi:MAG: quinone-dependent dihydroorotate dehydrogenase [Myxococcota bacterium]|nr:quinone-dependent dihydroorotate dehydrogenase [Myxococcota bacterium]